MVESKKETAAAVKAQAEAEAQMVELKKETAAAVKAQAEAFKAEVKMLLSKKGNNHIS